MFGKGIYSTKASSSTSASTTPNNVHHVSNLSRGTEAHLYTNDNPMSNNRAIIICRVVANRPERLLSADQQKSGVNAGYNSVRSAIYFKTAWPLMTQLTQVEGVTKAEGGALNYPETIVYWNDAIIPVGLILYGWDGTPDSDACALM